MRKRRTTSCLSLLRKASARAQPRINARDDNPYICALNPTVLESCACARYYDETSIARVRRDVSILARPGLIERPSVAVVREEGVVVYGVRMGRPCSSAGRMAVLMYGEKRLWALKLAVSEYGKKNDGSGCVERVKLM